MNKLKIISLTASIVLAITFTFSCSGDDGGGEEKYNYCIKDGFCHEGPYTLDGCSSFGGMPSNSCPNGGGGGSSSSVGGQGSSDKGNDIKNYRTVVIGTQTWMAENLNYAVEGSKCYGEGAEVYDYYDEENRVLITKTLSNAEVQANCTKYGRLYDWSTAMGLPSSCNENSCSSQIQSKHKGICPSGWHIPNYDEWNVLMEAVGGEYTAGTKLKATSGWDWDDYEDKSGNGTDQYGFSALPGGYVGYYGNGSFLHVGSVGIWWSASEYSSDHDANDRGMDNGEEGVHNSDDHKSSLFSVRCINDLSSGGNPSSSSSSSSVSVVHDTPVTYGSETYPTVVIGTQTWFAKNLNYAVEGSKCYDNDPANCTMYGRLYDWPTAMTVCPSGWHLPTDAEWATLGSYIGGFGNDYGFQPLRGGEVDSDGRFGFVGDAGFWWSASECYSDDVFCGGGFHPEGLLVYYGYTDNANWNNKGSLYSVRCVQD